MLKDNKQKTGCYNDRETSSHLIHARLKWVLQRSGFYVFRHQLESVDIFVVEHVKGQTLFGRSQVRVVQGFWFKVFQLHEFTVDHQLGGAQHLRFGATHLVQDFFGALCLAPLVRSRPVWWKVIKRVRNCEPRIGPSGGIKDELEIKGI